MNKLFFSEEHIALKNEIREFLSKELAPIKDEINKKKEIPISIIKKIGNHGYIGTLVPIRYNGTELGMIAHCIITEEIARMNVAVSVIRTPCILMNYLITNYGNEEQKEKYLKKMAIGEKLCSICVTEEEAGSNVAGIKTKAEKKGNNYILNGTKRFITNAGIADYYFIWAITNQNVDPRNGMSVFMVEKDTPGFKVENPYALCGMHGLHNGILKLENVEVPEENMIGDEGKGFDNLMATFNVERITLSSECNGISMAALEDSKKYAKNNLQFDKPISRFQIIRLKIAKMATNLRASRLLTYSAAKLHELNINLVKEASMAKAFSSKNAVKIASDAIQIHGGSGYTDNYSVERYFRDAKFFMIGGGTTEIQYLIIAREELN
ncbi:MAG: acyl-CoA dehydrogenase family protein [Promethearchaeati archaeon]